MAHRKQLNTKLVMEGMSDQRATDQGETITPTKFSVDIANCNGCPTLATSSGWNDVATIEEIANLFRKTHDCLLKRRSISCINRCLAS